MGKGERNMNGWCNFGLCGEKLTWELQGDMLFIDGEGEMDNYPPNHSVWAPMAWLIRSVAISNGVTSIGDYAFCGFPNLTSISLPNSVNNIGEGAFDDCPSMKEITVSRENASYYLWDGMLVDSSRYQPIWPPEKIGKPLGRFAVNENDCVFRIEAGRRNFGPWSGIACFGDSDTLIEIRESGGTIIDIECIYLEPTLHEPNLFLPDYRNDSDLEETEYFYCPDYEYATRHPCVVNVVRDRMEIILSENLDHTSCYHVEGRVEYYCNDQQEVVFIRISDLTEQEYRALR
jgi:hypothetical protein